MKSSLRKDSTARVPRRVTFADIKKTTRRSLFQSTEDLTTQNNTANIPGVDLLKSKNALALNDSSGEVRCLPRQTRSASKKAAALLKKAPSNSKMNQN